MTMMKTKEKEMKDEKEAERKVSSACRPMINPSSLLTDTQAKIETIKTKRAAKEEKERYEKMAEKMHKKRVERLKRKEKRNKLLNS